MSEFTLEPLYDYPQREQVLALARTHADAVDRGERSPFENLREIAKDGLITLGRDGGSLVPQVSVAFDLATEDASTAFSLWAHRSTIAFFDAVGRELPAWRLRPSAAPPPWRRRTRRLRVWHRSRWRAPSLRAV